jgi:UDP-glucose 4-epimerase
VIDDRPLRVLVTGGLGFTGRAVSRRLIDAGHQVVILTHRPAHAALDTLHGATLAHGDLSDQKQVQALITNGEFGAVCHLAARSRVRESFTDPLGYWDVNVGGTLHLLQALAAASDRTDLPARLVFASTVMVYGRTDGSPISESYPLAPTSPYGASKLAAEALISDQAATGTLGAVILRPFSIVGAVDGHSDPDESRIIPKAIATAAGRASRVEVNGDGSAVRDLTHVLDVADAFLLASAATEPGAHQVYNVGTGHGVTIRQVLETVETVTGQPLPVVYRPAAKEPAALIADSSRIQERLGWRPARSTIRQIIHDAWSAEPSRSQAEG